MMYSLTPEESELYDYINIITKKEERASRIINRTLWAGLLGGMIISLSQCASSCSHEPSNKYAMHSARDSLRMNELDLEGTTNRLDYHLRQNEFIKNHRELETALQEAQNKALDAKVASEKLFAEVKETPEWKTFDSMDKASEREAMVGLDTFVGSVFVPALLSWGAHSINKAVATRRRKPYEERLAQIRYDRTATGVLERSGAKTKSN